MAQIFISYSRVDTSFVEQLLRRIQQAFPHLILWHDQSPHGLTGGDNWWDEILNAIAESHIFIYVLSNESVQSRYCQAEFTEARRLQKRIITIQARDRTELTDDLDDIQFIDLHDGPDSADGLQRLNAAIYKQLSLARRQRPLWKPATPKPQKETLPARSAAAPSMETPALTPPAAEQEALKVAQQGLRWQVGLGLATLVVTLLVAIVGILPWLTERAENANATSTAGAATQLAQQPTLTPSFAPTAAPTETPAIPPTPTPTPTITPTGDLVWVAQTVIAEQSLQAMIAAATATAAQIAQYIIEIETQNAYETATATLWTTTPTPNLTASIEALITSWAQGTATQDPKNAAATATLWTDTPTPTSTPTLSPIQLPSTPVAHNIDWTPVEQDFDGVTMVLVPAGCFEMGSENYDNEKPIHQQCFDEPFWLDKYEVTNGQFARFGGEAYYGSRWSDDNYPRVNIAWVEAQNFCTKRKARLPTEREWEYAARGPDGWIYPWGNDWNPNNVVWDENSNNQTMAVGSKPNGISWVGTLDMSGNVWEWVSSVYNPYPYQSDDGRENPDETDIHVLRGASWGDIAPGYFRMSIRYSYNPGIDYGNNGFRCARSFE